MSTKAARIVLFICIIGAIQSGMAAQENAAAVRRQLEASYSAIAKAMKDKDADKVLSYATSDYVQKLANGRTFNRAQFEEELKNTLGSMETLDLSYRITSVVVGKGEAIASVRYAFSGKSKVESDPLGKPHAIEFNASMQATWVKVNNHWRVKRNEELKGAQLKIDGRPTERPLAQ